MTDTPSDKPEFSEEGFWAKLKDHAKLAGENVVRLALQLFYSAQEPTTPAWAKTTIFGALAYLIWPADAIPDIIPAAGYTDDLGALAAAVGIVAVYINDSVKAKAESKLRDWFG